MESSFAGTSSVLSLLIRRSAMALGVVSLCALYACSPNEPSYTTVQSGSTLVGTTTDNPARLAVLHEPDNTVQTMDAYASANGHTLDAAVTKIVQFDSTVFLLMPSVQKIEVISRNSYKSMASISTAPHSVMDVCFANSTTAYTANADSSVSIIDMTVQRLLPSRDIAVPGVPTGIAAVGNRLCVCFQNSNACSIIATPTNSVITTFSTPAAPTFVGGDAGTGSFVICCLGDGKLGSKESTHSPSHLIVYSTTTMNQIGDITLTSRRINPEDVQPTGMWIQNGGYAYVGLNSDLVLIDTRNMAELGTICSGSFTSFAYNAHRNELSCLDNSEATSFVTLVDLQSTLTMSVTDLHIQLSAILTP